MRKRSIIVVDLRDPKNFTYEAVDDLWNESYYIAGINDPVNEDPPPPHHAEPRKRHQAIVEELPDENGGS